MDIERTFKMKELYDNKIYPTIPGQELMENTQVDLVDGLLEELGELPTNTLSYLEDKINEEINKRYDYVEE